MISALPLALELCSGLERRGSQVQTKLRRYPLMKVQCECGKHIEVEHPGRFLVASCPDCMKYFYAETWDEFFHGWYDFTMEAE
jgi:hypothetical protein